jgi:hypothetical protein
VVGVLGPLRLAYGIAIPSVRYVSRIMTELLDEVGGASPGPTPTITRGAVRPRKEGTSEG